MDLEGQDYDFEDDRVELDRDSNIRRRYLRWFNKRREDFPNALAYDDYLEMVEDMVYNLVHNIDTEKTKANIDKYRRDNQDLIAHNEVKIADEQRDEREQISAVEHERIATLAELRKQDDEEEKERQDKRRQEEAEELLRISKGDDALDRLRKKRAKKERQKRRLEERAAKAAEEAAKPNDQPMMMFLQFPSAPPAPLWGEKKQKLEPDPDRKLNPEEQARAAKAAGFRQQFVYERALAEFTQSLDYLQLEDGT